MASSPTKEILVPQVSIVILNFNAPHNIQRLLPTLKLTSDVEYETVVVDNGSTPDVVSLLQQYHDNGDIDTLVVNGFNAFFSEGCNIGVRNSNPESEFVLLLNNDTEILDGAWLKRMIEWANGVPETLYPYDWTTHPTVPSDTRRGIVSIDWGYDTTVPGNVRPEGWCCLIRREAWREMSPDFPMNMGELEMMASAVRDGYPCGCLCQYGKYIKHHHGGSSTKASQRLSRAKVKRQPDMISWWADLTCESLDFTLGPNEHQSYMGW